MKTLEETYNSLMNQKHSLKESGANWETLDLLDDSIIALRKAIETMSEESIPTKTDSMFS